VKQPKKNSPLLYCSNRPGQRERERQTCFFSVAGRRQSRTETKSAGEGRRTIEEAGHRERSGRRDHRICRRERERESENLPERDAPDDGEGRTPREAGDVTDRMWNCTAEKFQRERVEGAALEGKWMK
jgi:hypothetical protein